MVIPLKDFAVAGGIESNFACDGSRSDPIGANWHEQSARKSRYAKNEERTHSASGENCTFATTQNLDGNTIQLDATT